MGIHYLFKAAFLSLLLNASAICGSEYEFLFFPNIHRSTIDMLPILDQMPKANLGCLKHVLRGMILFFSAQESPNVALHSKLHNAQMEFSEAARSGCGESAELHYYSALANLVLQKMDAASSSFERAIAKCKCKSVDYYYAYLFVLMLEKKYELIKLKMDQLLAEKVYHEAPLSLAVTASLITADSGSAEKYGKILVSHFPQKDENVILMATALWQAKKHAEALAIVEQQLINSPQNKQLLLFAAAICRKLGDPKGTKRYLELCTEYNSANECLLEKE